MTLAALVFHSITNTEEVRDIAVLESGIALAATSGGVDRFEHGRSLGAIQVEDGLPSHETWAIRAFGSNVFVATSRGLALVEGERAIPIGAGLSWHGLPEPLPGESAREYRARLLAIEPTIGAPLAAFAETRDRSARAFADGTIELFERDRLVRRTLIAGRPLALAIGDRAAIAVSTEEVMIGERIAVGPKAPLAARAIGEEIWIVDSTGASYRAGARGIAREDRRFPAGVTALAPNGELVGISGRGVHQAAGHRLTRTDQICSNHVTSAAKHQGRIVVGTFDRGICSSRDGVRWTRTKRPAIPSDVVYGVASIGENLWVATSHGLGVHDGRAFTHYAFGGRNPFALESLSVLAVLEVNGEALLVEKRGVSRVDSHGKLLGRDRTHASKAENVTAADAAGPYLWIATEDRGVLRFDGVRWRVYHDARDLPDNWVTAIDGDETGRAIAGTCQHGVAFLGTPERIAITRAQGLADDMVTAVQLLDGEAALAGTLGGLSLIESNQVSRSYGPRDGLADPRVASISILDGELWIGTEAGLSIAVLEANAGP